MGTFCARVASLCTALSYTEFMDVLKILTLDTRQYRPFPCAGVKLSTVRVRVLANNYIYLTYVIDNYTEDII